MDKAAPIGVLRVALVDDTAERLTDESDNRQRGLEAAEGKRTMETPPDAYRQAEPAERAAVAERIDPATAEVWFMYGSVLDPYGCPEEADWLEDNVARCWFAADPVEGIAVSFYDLPEATLHALEAKRQEADRLGWEAIYRGEIVGI
jgi:hypothetical protein